MIKIICVGKIKEKFYKSAIEEYIKRFNPSPAYFETWQGSLKDEFENSEEITPTDKDM